MVSTKLTSSAALWLRALGCALCGLASLVLGPAAMATELGATVTNRAYVTYDVGGDQVTIVTNDADFVIEAARTPSEIEFFRYAPTAPDAISVSLNGSDYAPDGNMSGPFVPIGDPVTAGGRVLDFSGPVPLVPADTYLAGELIIVHVTDLGQNGDPTRIETVSITIESSTGDTITLRLYESGPDTGEFYGWLPSTRDVTPDDDAVITVGRQARLTATYIDPFDTTEVSVDTALVDPFGRVFNALTGDLVDGAVVTIIDDATGEPAEVFGVDGTSVYPSTVTTGSTVTDASGLTYELAPGEFRFPLMAPGVYRLEIIPPAGLIYASVVAPGDFAALTNAPFEIIPASYGDTFTLTGSGPINLDVPLDPIGDVILRKTVDADNAGIGDFVAYTIEIENRNDGAAPIMIHDRVPAGFRFVGGSATVDGMTVSDPVIAADGRELRFNLAPLGPNESLKLSYVLEITAGARLGQQVNEAFLMGAAGQPLSGTSRASVFVRDELLSSRATIIGRVAEEACDGDERWTRDLSDGFGVEGVRLYMETGEYVVSDEHGLFHFEDVRPGTHVVQIDEETLPKGMVPMVCESNTRYAGKGTSKFVDVKGGSIWRANFYLKRTEDYVDEEQATLFNDNTEYLFYDKDWLNGQTPGTAWVYPDEGRTPSSPSVNIGIKHDPDQTVELYLNGTPVSRANIQSRDTDDKRTVMITRWRGVDILEGENLFRAIIKNEDGSTAGELRREIHYVEDVSRAIAMPDQSVLVADGRTTPVIAVRLEDGAGRPVHAGRIISVDIEDPYRAKDADLLEGDNPLTLPLSARGGVAIGPNGIARIELEPTLRTGRVTVQVKLDDGRTELISMYLQPEQRDWIVVGLAEADLGVQRIQDNIEGQDNSQWDVIRDGRVAFFAKGMIKGEFLLTLGVDTDKRRDGPDAELFNYIDPNAYYTLYGDRTWQDDEAASRYPLYLKLEKNTFFAMFGDYSTDLNETRLTQYSRRLSGFKTVHSGERFQVMAFAAETNQGFNKDEIAADGTSGPYRLSQGNILVNSEEIRLETRDRFRNDLIVDSKLLVRYIDYDIDYFTGELVFRLPVNATDAAFNPVVIVADYETRAGTEKNITFGGRASVGLFGNFARVAATYVHEGGSTEGAGLSGDMVGVDLVADLSRQTQLRAEYGYSSNETLTGDVSASAYLAELTHKSEQLAAQVFFKQEDAGYGLGQRTSATRGLRRYGAEVAWKFSQFENANGRRGQRFVELLAMREENLSTGGQRDRAEIGLRQEGERFSFNTGLRAVRESFSDGKTRQSILAIAGGRWVLTDLGLTLSASYEQPLGGNDEVSLFPQRLILGIDKRLGDRTTLQLRHERSDGSNLGRRETTTAGIAFQPWAGTEVTAATDWLTGDSGRRLGATIGVDQQWQLNDHWSAAVGATRYQVLSQEGLVRDPVADDPLAPTESSPDFTSAYAGVGYRTENMSATGRLEYRDNLESTRYVASLAAARELSEELSFAAAIRVQHGDFNDGTDERRADARIGLAWRPRGEGLVVFDRLDLKYNDTRQGFQTSKLINNLGVNWMAGERWQNSLHWGFKYTEANLAGQSYSGVTNLVGGETRYDIFEGLDLGFHGQVLHSGNTGNYSFAYGPSIGISPLENTWISLGYNVSGFKDEDFEAAEYSREGPYIKFRLKFDQDSLDGLLRRVSPDAPTDCDRRCVQ